MGAVDLTVNFTWPLVVCYIALTTYRYNRVATTSNTVRAYGSGFFRTMLVPCDLPGSTAVSQRKQPSILRCVCSLRPLLLITITLYPECSRSGFQMWLALKRYRISNWVHIHAVGLCPYLVDGEGLELGGTELLERHALVLVINACDGQSDAGGLSTGWEAKVVQYGRHGDAGLVVIAVVVVVVVAAAVFVVAEVVVVVVVVALGL